MNDRFKFKGYWYNDYLKEWQVYDNPQFITGDGTAEIWYNTEGGAHPELPFDAELHLCQCTGLKDKNGKLIYEGDILDLYISTKKLYRYQVKYEIGSFMLVSNEEIFDFRNKWNDNAYPLSQFYFEYDNEDNCIWQCEVIGNIYENKELLEDTDER